MCPTSNYTSACGISSPESGYAAMSDTPTRQRPSYSPKSSPSQVYLSARRPTEGQLPLDQLSEFSGFFSGLIQRALSGMRRFFSSFACQALDPTTIRGVRNDYKLDRLPPRRFEVRRSGIRQAAALPTPALQLAGLRPGGAVTPTKSLANGRAGSINCGSSATKRARAPPYG